MTDQELAAHLIEEPIDAMDELAMDMVPVAARFVVAVHDRETDVIHRAIHRLSRQQRDALLVVLAAMVPDGIGVRDLLAWVDDPDWARNKRCSHCGEIKPRSEFTQDMSKRDGKRGVCRGCDAAARRRAA